MPIEVEKFSPNAQLLAEPTQLGLLADAAMHDGDVVVPLHLGEHPAHLVHVNVLQRVHNELNVVLRGVVIAHVLVGIPLRIHYVHVLVLAVDFAI